MRSAFRDIRPAVEARGKHWRPAPAGALLVRLLSLTGLLACALNCAAQSPPAEDLDQVRLRIDKLEQSLAGDEVKFKAARKDVLEIERRLHAARQDNEKFRLALDTKVTQIAALRAKRDRLNQIYAETTRSIEQTLLARYMLWRQPKLKVLLNNSDIAALNRNLRYYDYVATANNQSLQAQRLQLDELRGIESALKLEAGKLRQLRDERENHLKALKEALSSRGRVVESLQALLQQNEKALEQLQDDEAQLAKLVDEVSDGIGEAGTAAEPFGDLKGALAWPTTGRIAKAPGGAMREGGAKWSGVIIESAPGSDVAAVADGQVVFADWFRNLGLLVIIDHGDGYMSLYGHNQELYKQGGDWVSAGEIVATVGDTGGQSTTGLYFEIRQDGVAQDPRQWCRK